MPTDRTISRDAAATTVRTWRAMYQVAEQERDTAEQERDQLRTRVAELEAENEAVDQGRPEALVDLLCAVAAGLPEETPEEHADRADRQWRRAYRVAVRATGRVDELKAAAGLRGVVAEAASTRADEAERRATAAEKRAAELEWIESTSCCGDQANQYGVRARTAEAAVERVRAALADVEAEADKRRGYRETQAAERAGLIMAISRIREALDAAGTPASTQPAREPSTAEHGSWKPEIFPIVDALRGIDWAGFDPAKLDDLADVAAVIAAELFPPAPEDQLHNMPAEFTPPAATDAMVQLCGDLDQEAGTLVTSPDVVKAAQGLGLGIAASRMREALADASAPAETGPTEPPAP